MIVGEACSRWEIVNGYLYYSLLVDNNGKAMKDNLFRINLDTLGKTGQLYLRYCLDQ